MASSDQSQTTAAPAARKIKYTILAALAAVVAVAVFVSVFFIVLSPARVNFTVTHARCSKKQISNDRDAVIDIDLAVAANNTSKRAAVEYQSMFVDVANGTEYQSWVIRAEVSPWSMPPQPPTNVMTMEATVSWMARDWGIDTTNMQFLVIITAQARFKVGIARTRLYDIKVTCWPLNYKYPNCSQTLPLHCVY